MAERWLLRDGEVLASVEVADTFKRRLKGLLGRDGIDGALYLAPAKSVHTAGMRFAIDVAFCDREMAVLCTMTLPPWRVTRPRAHAHAVIEARAGAFDQWGLRPGDRLEVQ